MEEKYALKTQFVGLDNTPAPTTCLLCDVLFVLPTNQKELLLHLYQEHRLVIGDVWEIASLKSYIYYWKVKFKEAPFEDFCTMLLMDCKPDGTPSKNESYFLLSKCISEDKILRDEIHRAKLEWVLSEQSKERLSTNFKRGCIFCRMEFSGSRVAYIKHLSDKHNLYLGKPENLVFLDEFLDKIQHTIESLICIYCEKLFKDRIALKEHMRKKLHKRINPKNKDYDKYYINNYLEIPKLSKQTQDNLRQIDVPCSSPGESDNEDEDTWSDWNDDDIGITCLFCNHNDKQFQLILYHMQTQHNFDFATATEGLTFYQKVKVVNYIRRQIHLLQCVFCEAKMENILQHMKEEDHYKIPAQRLWDQPEFYFPMCESDSFLYNLDISGNSDEDEK